MVKKSTSKSKQLKKYRMKINELGKEKTRIDQKLRSLPKLQAKYNKEMEIVNTKSWMLHGKIDQLK